MSMSNEIYDQITERVLAALDRGVIPWRKPWRADLEAPRNLASGRFYRGINVWLLLLAGYETPFWLTFRQALALKGNVRKGEHGSQIIFWKRIEVPHKGQLDTVDDPDAPRTRTIPIMTAYTVFNAAQCDNIAVPDIPFYVNNDPIEGAEEIVAGMPLPPELAWDGRGRAYYLPSEDTVHLPTRASFESAEAVYGTMFHELAHATGHPSRLAREGIEKFDHFGSDRYGREELCAEMAAAYLCGEAGLAPALLDNTSAYIRSWMSTLKTDTRAVVTAASRAQHAADYILGRLSNEPAD